MALGPFNHGQNVGPSWFRQAIDNAFIRKSSASAWARSLSLFILCFLWFGFNGRRVSAWIIIICCCLRCRFIKCRIIITRIVAPCLFLGNSISVVLSLKLRRFEFVFFLLRGLVTKLISYLFLCHGIIGGILWGLRFGYIALSGTWILIAIGFSNLFLLFAKWILILLFSKRRLKWFIILYWCCAITRRTIWWSITGLRTYRVSWFLIVRTLSSLSQWRFRNIWRVHFVTLILIQHLIKPVCLIFFRRASLISNRI